MRNMDIGAIILRPGCMNHCPFCGPVRKANPEELKKQEIAIVKNVTDFKKQGIRKLEISGSDPIEYDKLIPLVKYLRSEGFLEIQLSTHGNNFGSESFFDEVIRSGITKVRIPLYGSNAAIHDLITQRRGSFDSVVRGLHFFKTKAPQVGVQISTIIMPYNKDDINNIIDLVMKLGITDFYISVPCVADGNYSYLIPFKDLTPNISNVYQYSLDHKFFMRFREIPFCVFGVFDKERIINTDTPPNLGRYCQPPSMHKSEIPDVPLYRMKRHEPFCSECVGKDHCDGFFINDIEKFGTGSLKQISKN